MNSVVNMKKDKGVIIPKIAIKKLRYVVKHVETFFPHKLSKGYESRNRRFLLKSNGELIYHHDNRSKRTTLLRLLVSLSFTRNKIFRILKTANVQGKVIAFSKDEKSAIKALVTQSELPVSQIPCSKIRYMCDGSK